MFSPGLKQKFAKGICQLDLSQYAKHQLVTQKDDYYPIVIGVETVFPESYKGRTKKNVQFTYGTFEASEEGGKVIYKIKTLKQQVLYNKTIFDLNDVFGVDNGTISMDDNGQTECVICYTNLKDTVVLPCRHLCLCQGCSQIVRLQNNTCPICRSRVTAFLQIKVGNQQQAVEEAEQNV